MINLYYNTYMVHVYIAGAIIVIILASLSILSIKKNNKKII